MLGIVAQVAMFSNYAKIIPHAHGLPALPVWSLAVEEHFYLLAPVLFCLMRRWLSWPQIAVACLGLCVVSLIIRAASVPYADEINILRFSHARMASILFGCCLAFWKNPILDRTAAWRPKRDSSSRKVP